jgi:hypothetical protein
MIYRLFLPTAAIVLFAGCAGPIEEGEIHTSGTVGFSAGLGSAQAMSSTTTSGAVSTAATFVLAHYEATENQRIVALRNAKRAIAVIHSQPKKREAMKRKKIRYLAVDTVKDERAKGEATVMLFDSESEQLVGKDVYDVRIKPPLGVTAQFETYAATYVGTGS